MKLVKTLALAEEIVRLVPCYELGCTISEEAAVLSYTTMKRGIR